VTGFNLSAFAVREHSLTLFLIIAIAIAGAFAYLNLGRAEDPAFTVKVLTVTVSWPGATAQEMQDLVADPLEKRIQELRWYDHVDTFTRPGLAFMTINLLQRTPPGDVQEEFYQARKKIGDEFHNLPDGVLPPVVNDEYSDVTFAIYTLKARGLPERLLVRQAEALRMRLLHVPGVEKVNIIGEQPERIFVDFSVAKLSTLGLSARDIFNALQQQNAVTAAGSIDTRGPQTFVRLDGAYDDLQKIRDTPIVAGGRTLKLSDVAEVERGYQDPPTLLIRHDGDAALLLGVVMRDGWNGLELGKALEVEAAAIQKEMPLGFSFSEVVNQQTFISLAVNEFTVKFVIALVVIMAVSLISLGWRVGIVVAAAVPLTLSFLFVIMLATGREFDRISLGAVILALGLLVDDAIIAVEMMVVKMEEGVKRVEAAAYAWSHTAAPMLTGTLLTAIGLMPIGFAQSAAGEYAGGIFWIVSYALLASWFVAVVFTPYLGVKLLPDIKPVPGGHKAIYSTPRYRRFRSVVAWAVEHKFKVAISVIAIFFTAVLGLGFLGQQFFPTAERPEVLVEVRMAEGTSIEATRAVVEKVERYVRKQPEANTVVSFIGSGGVRFFLPYNPELPDPAFAKIVIWTQNPEAREALKLRIRDAVARGLAPEAHLRVTQFIFGPPTPFPVAFRVMGPDAATLRGIADQVAAVVRTNKSMRDVDEDWGPKVPQIHLVLDQDRLRLIGLSPNDVAQQVQFLLTGATMTQVREDIRTVDVVARSVGTERLDPAKLENFILRGSNGRSVPLSQIGRLEIRDEDPILKRRDHTPTIEVRGDIDESLQAPQVEAQVWRQLKPLMAKLPDGYRLEMAGNPEEAAKANTALAEVFPVMLVLMLVVIMIQVRSFPALAMVFLTAPLGLAGAVPILFIFHQPFGFGSILGVIGLAGILMRNTLILIGQIHTNEAEGMKPYHAVVEATVQRARPVALTATAAVLAFIPLTYSAFWGPLAYTLIGGTAVGTILTLVFLPAAYAIWFKIKPAKVSSKEQFTFAEAIAP
jgi:multidrug efflux pump subunit AcrB